MKAVNEFLRTKLHEREASDSLRSLQASRSLVDFCSNDYLGFSRSPLLKDIFNRAVSEYPDYRLGSGGSRLLAGNDPATEQIEREIASFHNAGAALVFNSGYDANVGLLSCVPQRGDTVISDELNHASIIDGIRLSHANRFTFRHNDLDSLHEKLRSATGKIFIVTESVFSMDGDEAPLTAICELAEQFGAAVIVDEAHAVGVFGARGRGLVNETGLEDKVFARIVTFGKALGTHGATVLGSRDLHDYLINFARSFIFTTSAPLLNHIAVRSAYRLLADSDHQHTLKERVALFRTVLNGQDSLLPGRSPIQILRTPGNHRARSLARSLQDSGFDVRAILSPTVAAGSERLRICLHNHNTPEEITELCYLINKLA